MDRVASGSTFQNSTYNNQDPTILSTRGSRTNSITDLNEFELQSPSIWCGNVCDSYCGFFILAIAIGMLLAVYTSTFVVEDYKGQCDITCCANICCQTCSNCPWSSPTYESCNSSFDKSIMNTTQNTT